MARKHPKPADGILLVEWKCPDCEKLNQNPIEIGHIQGGCQGHGPGEYCYCSDPEIRQRLSCASCGVEAEVAAS